MRINLKQSDLFWTRDGQRLGHPHRIHHRTSDLILVLALHACYVHAVSFKLGINYYIPLVYLGGRNRDHDRITLTAPTKRVQRKTWDRIPDIVAHGEAEWEELPGKPFEKARTKCQEDRYGAWTNRN